MILMAMIAVASQAGARGRADAARPGRRAPRRRRRTPWLTIAEPRVAGAIGGHDGTLAPRTAESTIPPDQRRLVWRIDATLLDFVFLLGLGGVFLSNAAVAVIQPQTFTTLVAESPLGRLIGDATWVAPFITANDLLIGLAVIAVHRFQRLRLAVLTWAGIWLMIVTVLKATTM